MRSREELHEISLKLERFSIKRKMNERWVTLMNAQSRSVKLEVRIEVKIHTDLKLLVAKISLDISCNGGPLNFDTKLNTLVS